LADASVDHLVIQDDVILDIEYALYEAWYKDKYYPALRSQNRIDFMTFPQWLISKGARETTNEEVLEYYEN